MISIRLCDLTIGYKLRHHRARVVASGINALFPGGQMTCILGRNGVGKSTLLRTIAGQQAPISGEICLKEERGERREEKPNPNPSPREGRNLPLTPPQGRGSANSEQAPNPNPSPREGSANSEQKLPTHSNTVPPSLGEGMGVGFPIPPGNVQRSTFNVQRNKFNVQRDTEQVPPSLGEGMGVGLTSTLISLVLSDKIDDINISAFELVSLGRTPYTGFFGTLHETDRQIVEEAMQMTGISHLADRRITTLSDGERQKVMIARALAQQTPIILMDEPTAFLDWDSRIELMQTMSRLAHEQGKTVVMSTHDVPLAKEKADCIFEMK